MFIRFFKNTIYSFTSAKFYQELLRAPLSFSLKYLALLLLFLSFLYAVYFQFTLLPFLNQALNNSPKAVEKLLPEDFSLAIKKGRTEFGGREPFVVSFTDIYRHLLPEKKQVVPAERNLIVIDTQTPVSVRAYTNFSTIYWLTENSFVGPAGRGSADIEILPLNDVADASVDREMILKGLKKILPTAKAVLKVMYFALWPLYFLVFFAVKIVNLFFISLFVFLIGKLVRFRFSLKKSYQLAIHGSTLPFFVEATFFLLPVPLRIPLGFELLTLIVVFFFLRNTETKEIRI